MPELCHACAAPLAAPDVKGPAEDFCRFCTDERGQLKPRDQVRQGIAGWLKSWQPGLTDAQALERAGHYMKAMPAWAG